MLLNLRSILLLVVLIGTSNLSAEEEKPLIADNHTQLLLRVNDSGTALRDVTRDSIVRLSGATIVADERFGHVVRLGPSEGVPITVEDGGRFDFAKGFTLEAWLQLGDTREAVEAMLAEKDGSFSFRIGKERKLDVRRVLFPRLPVVTTHNRQIGYFPVSNEAFGGATSMPTGQWVHLAVTYDPDRAVIRTWIDGSQDRVRYLTRQYGTTMQVDRKAPLKLFEGLSHVRIGPVRISGIARNVGPANPLEVYVHQLPYQKRIVLQFAHLGSDLPYPLQTSVNWENPTGPASVIYRGVLTGPADKLVELEPQGWNNDYYNLHVRVTAGNQELYSRMVRVANARAAPKSRIAIRPDKRISVNGKTIFPLVLYHVQLEDFQYVADLGFHFITPRAPDSPFLDFGRRSETEFRNIQAALDAAEKADVQLILPARISYLDPVFRFQDHPALGAWSVYDEPWGVSLDKMVDSFNAIKMLNQEVPLVSVQNNLTRMSETGEGVDILACDPYCIPAVSLRMVPNATRAARRAVADLKPVWTLLCQYQSGSDNKRPTLQELRCMLYLSIAAGADGIGIYCWDYRRDGPDGQKRWCTKNSPRDLEILRAAIKELRSIEDVLIIPNDDAKVAFTKRNPAVHVALKSSAEGNYLVIANDSRGPEQATVDLQGVGSATAVCLTDDSRLPIHDGSLKLELPPLAARVYRIESAR